MGHSPENLDQRGCRFPDETKIELKRWNFLNDHYVSDVMCLEK